MPHSLWAGRAGSTAGVAEFSARLGAAGQGSIDLAGRKTGIGRILRITSNDIPVLPTGELCEVWFIAPDDTAAHPDRISAGTFHPDAKGHTDVSLTAAVVPSKYPVLAITAEAGDGNPAASTTEVTRVPLSIPGRLSGQDGRRPHLVWGRAGDRASTTVAAVARATPTSAGACHPRRT